MVKDESFSLFWNRYFWELSWLLTRCVTSQVDEYYTDFFMRWNSYGTDPTSTEQHIRILVNRPNIIKHSRTCGSTKKIGRKDWRSYLARVGVIDFFWLGVDSAAMNFRNFVKSPLWLRKIGQKFWTYRAGKTWALRSSFYKKMHEPKIYENTTQRH